LNIACAIDEKYAQHCGVMLSSLFVNNPDVSLSVYVINDGLSTAARARLDSVARQFQQQLRFESIDTTLLGNARISAHLSLATYFRLLIPRVLPPDVEKVLFLDSDLIVRSSIVELYDTAFEEHTLAAVENPFSTSDAERLALPTGAAYFNAGVLLINLRAWRDEGTCEKAIEYINAQADVLRFHDQDALNATLRGRWRKCSPVWNAQEAFFLTRCAAAELGVDKRELRSTRSNPRIVHFTGSAKPWDGYLNHPFEDEYFKYLAWTPWKGHPRPGRPSRLRQLASQVAPVFVKQTYRRFRDQFGQTS
jgi:lipopolysaccharide biosynthesis glycosyltransferase